MKAMTENVYGFAKDKNKYAVQTVEDAKLDRAAIATALENIALAFHDIYESNLGDVSNLSTSEIGALGDQISHIAEELRLSYSVG